MCAARKGRPRAGKAGKAGEAGRQARQAKAGWSAATTSSTGNRQAGPSWAKLGQAGSSWVKLSRTQYNLLSGFKGVCRGSPGVARQLVHVQVNYTNRLLLHGVLRILIHGSRMYHVLLVACCLWPVACCPVASSKHRRTHKSWCFTY